MKGGSQFLTWLQLGDAILQVFQVEHVERLRGVQLLPLVVTSRLDDVGVRLKLAALLPTLLPSYNTKTREWLLATGWFFSKKQSELNGKSFSDSLKKPRGGSPSPPGVDDPNEDIVCKSVTQTREGTLDPRGFVNLACCRRYLRICFKPAYYQFFTV